MFVLQPPTVPQQAVTDLLMARQIKRRPLELMERPQAMVLRRTLMGRGRLLMDQVDNLITPTSQSCTHLQLLPDPLPEAIEFALNFHSCTRCPVVLCILPLSLPTAAVQDIAKVLFGMLPRQWWV